MNTKNIPKINDEDNPYKVVREERSENKRDNHRSIRVLGYDKLGRKVSVFGQEYNGDNLESYSTVIVGSDGYWYGGGGIMQLNGEMLYCEFAPIPFNKDNEEK